MKESGSLESRAASPRNLSASAKYRAWAPTRHWHGTHASGLQEDKALETPLFVQAACLGAGGRNMPGSSVLCENSCAPRKSMDVELHLEAGALSSPGGGSLAGVAMTSSRSRRFSVIKLCSNPSVMHFLARCLHSFRHSFIPLTFTECLWPARLESLPLGGSP